MRVGELAVAYLDDRFAKLPDTLTVRQLAELIGRDPRTVRRLLDTGGLPGYPVGDSWVIWRDEVKQFLEDSRRERRDRAAAGEILADGDELGLDD